MARHRAEHDPDVTSEADAPDRDPQTAAEESDERADRDETDDARGADGADDDAGRDAETDGGTDDDEADADDESEPARERSAEADEFWQRVHVDPIEVALPAGVGYTLRAYRAPDEVEAVDGERPVGDGADEPADNEHDAEERDAGDGGRHDRPDARADEAVDTSEDTDTEDDDTEDDGDADAGKDADTEDADADDTDTEDEESAEDGPDEVPLFLSRRGRLLLFRTPEALVEFVRGDAPHALRGIAGYNELAEGIRAEHVAADEQDHYELDLVVGNLRGGHDAWEPRLIVSAGELARDLAYALGLSAVLTSLAPGSPLDDLDDAARAASNGGFRAFRARRRMRRIGAQQAALAWRTIIGKISAAVDWRE